MNYFLYFTISSLLILILLMIVYFSKKKLKTVENKIYSILIICTLIGSITEISMSFTVKLMNTMPIINTIAAKGYLVITELWICILCAYTFYVTTKNNYDIKNKKTIFYTLIIIYIICAFTTCYLPIYYFFPDGFDNYTYTYGPSTKMVFITGILYILISLYYSFTVKGKIFTKKTLPIYCYIALSIFVSILQQISPSITLISYVEIFITILMYFTLENPDLKMIGELKRNKTIIEKTNQGNSNFMFRMTTEAKQYIKNITDIANKSLETKKYTEDVIKNILNQTKDADLKINNLIDISAIDVKNIKIVNRSYDTLKLFEEIKLKIKKRITEKINFIINISPNLPNKLSGDSIRIKQIILSVLENSIKNTKNGFISLDVNTIIKYDICRLIITIEDSGKGLNLETVNDILSNNEEITETELNQSNTLDMNLKIVKKTLNLLGGNFMIYSEEGKGTKVIIVLDQLIEKSNYELETNISEYDKILDIKKVLIIDDDLTELNTMENIFSQLNIETVCAMTGSDCLNRIRLGQQFDLIILNDYIKDMNATEILSKIKKQITNIPVIVILDDKKAAISHHYIEEGFKDFIIKSKLEIDLKAKTNKLFK